MPFVVSECHRQLKKLGEGALWAELASQAVELIHQRAVLRLRRAPTSTLSPPGELQAAENAFHIARGRAASALGCAENELDPWEIFLFFTEQRP